jgi:hypothetical protein
MMTDHPLTALEGKLNRLVAALEEVDRELILLSEEDPISRDDAERVSESLVTLNVFRSNLADTYKAIEGITLGVLGDFEDLTLPSGIKLEKKVGRSRSKWQHRDLAREVARRVVDRSVDHDTGEMLMSTQEVAESMLKYAAPAYWRIKELQKIGINADKYSDPGELKESIAVRRPKPHDEDD